MQKTKTTLEELSVKKQNVNVVYDVEEENNID